MENKNLIESLLNFGNNWKVNDIQLNHSFKEVDIIIEYIGKKGVCPTTKETCNIYDFRPIRRLRHLDIFDYKTFINVRIPRVKNKKSQISTIDLDWADKRVSYTYLFEGIVIKLLLASKNQSKTAEFFDISFDIIHSIMCRAVKRGMLSRNTAGVLAICLDEKSIKSGHKYVTVLSDPINQRVLDIVEGRDEDSTSGLITWTIHPDELENVQLAVMDMWKPYMNSVKETLLNAEIVHDKFHIAKYLNDGMDQVRRAEVKQELCLKKTKYIFLKNPDKWTYSQSVKFDEIKRINTKTSRAWEIKENFKGFYEQTNINQCLSFFKKWYEDVLLSGIKNMIKVADTILNHLEGVVNASLKGITNSYAENLNSQIQVVKTVGRGFANADNYRNSILFYYGKLQLFPLKIL